MVDGVHGLKEIVVRVVVEEQRDLIEHVTIPHHHVEDYLVEELVSMKNYAMNFAVVVRLYIT